MDENTLEKIKDIESDGLARAAIDALVALVFDASGTLLYASPPFTFVTGWEKADMSGRGLDLVTPDHAALLSERPPGALRLRKKDGSEAAFESRTVPAPGGLFVCLLGPLQEVSAERLADVIENFPLGFAVTDEDGRFLLANATLWREIFGYASREEFLARRTVDLYANPLDRERVIGLIKSGAASEFEIRCRRRDGSEITGLLTAVTKGEAAGRGRNICIFQDITFKRRAEQEMLKAQKLDSITVLAGRIAHDFNNLLLGVLGSVSVAREYVDPGHRAFKMLLDIEESARKAKSLAKEILTFSKGGDPVKEPASVEEIIKDTAGLLLRTSNVAVKYSFPPGLWNAVVDEGLVSQAFNNVILNSMQAMPDGGAIEIGAENAEIKDGGGLPLRPGSYVKITFKDRGMGMPKKLVPRIFDPFFTTKEKASGLGLALSYSIIKKHHGCISADSDVGKGMTTVIYLPAAAREREPEPAGCVLSGRVLVMDDEKIVRAVASEMIELMGLECVLVSDGDEAVEAFRKAKEEGEPFGLAILDLTVPNGMGGLEAVTRIREIDPDATALVSSGYSKDPIIAGFQRYGFSGVIVKPYTFLEFQKAVTAALTRGQRR